MKNEKAVSPVIGVILIVVITVIIAAILAAFAFGIGQPTKAPAANFKFVDSEANGLTISDQGGDGLILKNLQMTIYDAKDHTTPILASTSMDSLTGAPATGTLSPGQSFITAAAGTAGDLVDIEIFDTITGQFVTQARVTVGP